MPQQFQRPLNISEYAVTGGPTVVGRRSVTASLSAGQTATIRADSGEYWESYHFELVMPSVNNATTGSVDAILRDEKTGVEIETVFQSYTSSKNVEEAIIDTNQVDAISYPISDTEGLTLEVVNNTDGTLANDVQVRGIFRKFS